MCEFQLIPFFLNGLTHFLNAPGKRSRALVLCFMMRQTSSIGLRSGEAAELADGYHAWSVGAGDRFGKLSFQPMEQNSTSIQLNAEHLSDGQPLFEIALVLVGVVAVWGLVWWFIHCGNVVGGGCDGENFHRCCSSFLSRSLYYIVPY